MTIEKKSVHFSLTPSAERKIEKASSETGLTKSQVIENLVGHYIENFTRKFS